MSIGLATRGYYGGGAGAGAVLPPRYGNVVGATSLDSFRIARATPLQFDLFEISAGAQIAITVYYTDRNEVYTARGLDGVWNWPFDVEPANSFVFTGLGQAHVTMFPRGGWPPAEVIVNIAACRGAVPA